MEDTTFALNEVQMEHEIRDLQKAFETMELVPLVLPTTICLFCLADDELTSQARIASFSRIDSLRWHMTMYIWVTTAPRYRFFALPVM